MSYTDTNLECGKTYYYRISTANECSQQTKKSASVSAKTYSCCTKPSVPGGLSAVVNQTSVNISWSAVSETTGYRLYRDTSATGSFTQEIYSGAGTSYTDSLNCGTAYYYKVLAEISCGQSEKSSYVSAMITKPSDPSWPLFPIATDLYSDETGKVTSISCCLSWNKASGAARYKLYKDTSATGSFTQQIYSGSDTRYCDSISQCGKTYYYRLVAENSCGQSSSTDTSYSPGCCVSYPSAPDGLAITAISSNSVKISWNALPVSNPSSVSYSLYKGESPYPIYTGSATSYTHTGLDCGWSYHYSVSAVSECGESEKSVAATIKLLCVWNSTGAKTD